LFRTIFFIFDFSFRHYLDLSDSNVDVFIQGITLQGGKPKWVEGSAIHVVTDGKVEIDKCVIRNNSSSTVKLISNGKIDMNKCVITKNKGSSTLIYLASESDLLIKDNSLLSNSIDNGSLISIDFGNSNILMIDNTIMSNTGRSVVCVSVGDHNNSGTNHILNFEKNMITKNESREAHPVLNITYLKSIFITSNTITNNPSGIKIGNCYTAKIINNIIKHNSNGSIAIAKANNISITSNEIIGNKVADSNQVGFYVNNINSGLISNNYIAWNNGFHAGGIKSNNSNLTILNNIIIHNTSEYTGGGISLFYGGTTNIINNSIYNNKCRFAASMGGGLYIEANDSTSFNIYNNIFWNNTAPTGNDIYIKDYADSAALYNNIYTDLVGAYDQAGNNSDSDPMFADPQNNDYHLSPNSPCINAGNNDAPNLPETDLDYLPRIVDNVVDIGAYEFTTTEKIPSDQNEDWALTQEEFNAYAEAWRKGETWQKGPEPIPIDYVTRSGYLQKKGENYKNEGGKKPTCWKPDENNTKK
jgi:hypothetical protein